MNLARLRSEKGQPRASPTSLTLHYVNVLRPPRLPRRHAPSSHARSRMTDAPATPGGARHRPLTTCSLLATPAAVSCRIARAWRYVKGPEPKTLNLPRTCQNGAARTRGPRCGPARARGSLDSVANVGPSCQRSEEVDLPAESWNTLCSGTVVQACGGVAVGRRSMPAAAHATGHISTDPFAGLYG